jgi:bifunctional DNA-binding transcriptional regulator/antitoxin component of YhaV-PrlF toxin-antitoxin module
VLTSPVFHRIESVHEDLIGTAMARCRHLFRRFRRFAMIQVYVPVLERRRITIPLVAYKEMGVEPGGWLRLSVVEHGRALLERVPPEMPTALMTHGAAAIGAALEAERDARGLQR